MVLMYPMRADRPLLNPFASWTNTPDIEIESMQAPYKQNLASDESRPEWWLFLEAPRRCDVDSILSPRVPPRPKEMYLLTHGLYYDVEGSIDVVVEESARWNSGRKKVQD